MSIFEYAGRTYEVQEFSPADEVGFHYELWDLGIDGGMVGRAVVSDSGDPGQVMIELSQPVPAGVLVRWLREVPDLADRFERD